MDVIKSSVIAIGDNIFHVSGVKNVRTALATLEETQNAMASIYTRLMITTCLCLSPKNNANSLPALIAAIVYSDTNIKMADPIVLMERKT